MNELLERISKDLENERNTLSENVIFDVKIASSIVSDNELEGKLILVAGKYLCDIEKKENDIKELRSKIYHLNKFIGEMRKEYAVPYKKVLSEKNEKGLAPAKKFISEETVQQLENMEKKDSEICEILGISRSTLWRRRKEWETKVNSALPKDKGQSENKVSDSKYRFNW